MWSDQFVAFSMNECVDFFFLYLRRAPRTAHEVGSFGRSVAFASGARAADVCIMHRTHCRLKPAETNMLPLYISTDVDFCDSLLYFACACAPEVPVCRCPSVLRVSCCCVLRTRTSLHPRWLLRYGYMSCSQLFYCSHNLVENTPLSAAIKVLTLGASNLASLLTSLALRQHSDATSIF